MTQQQVLHGIKTDGAQPEGVLHGVLDFLVGEIFQKSQHLHEFPLAPPSHPGLQQTAQRSELFGELPSLQRSGLVQGRRLLLQQGQVVAGIEDEVVPFVGAGMSGNDLSAAADHHLSHVAFYTGDLPGPHRLGQPQRDGAGAAAQVQEVGRRFGRRSAGAAA